MPSRKGRLNSFLAASVIVGLFLAAALPLILTHYEVGRAADDQNHWHLPAIVRFAADWPHPDLSDYRSATTPGYHLALAALSRIAGSSDEQLLRCIAAGLTVILLATLAWVASRRSAAAGIILCLPMVVSLYVFSSGVWLLPDNAGWLGVLLALLLALRRRVDVWTYLGTTILIFLLILVRQSDLCMAAPLCLSTWLGSDDESAASKRIGSRCGRLVLAILATVPSLIALGYFFHLWHGMVPPTPARNAAGGGESSGGNPAATALLLATFALFTPFYLPWLKVTAKNNRWPIVVGTIVGLLAGVLPATTFDPGAGRWSGLWRLGRMAPAIADRSTAIALLSAVGGGLLGYLFTMLPRRDRWIFLATWLAFAAAQSANRQAWQRYIDPFILMTLILIAAQSTRGSQSDNRVSLARICPMVLAALLAGITVIALI